MGVPEFTVDVFYNACLPAGEREINAIVSVTSAGSAGEEWADVGLRVWTPYRATVRFLRQVAPTVEDLTARRRQVGRQAGDYPTGAWAAAESRDYHVCIEIDEAAPLGKDMLATRVHLIANAASEPLTLGGAIVRVTWTDDASMTERSDSFPGTFTLDTRKVGDADRKAGRGMFQRFTDRGRKVVVLAREEATRLNHNSIGTEHILLGLIREGEGVAVQVLESLGLDLEAVRQQVEEVIGQGKQASSTHIPFTPRAKKVLELSLREAMQLGHNSIGTEHILLGLIREGEGVAAQVLLKLGADLNRARQRVIQLLGDSAADVTGSGGVESRLSVVEQRVGISPATADLDQQIRQARRDRHAAISAEDYERAASMREREQELLADKASRQQQWAADHPDLPSLAEKVRQLSEEIERLRGLLRPDGPDPDKGTA